MDVLIVEALPRWLSTLQISRLAPEKQPLARALQQQAEEALNHHFSEQATREAASPPPNTKRSEESYRSSFDLMRDGARLLEAGFEALEEEQQVHAEEHRAIAEHFIIIDETLMALGEHLVETKERVARLERGEPHEPGAGGRRQTTVSLEPSSGPRLSKDHLHQAYALAHDERRRSGQRVDTLFAELAETFGVEDMSDIPDAGWQEVASWFWERRQRGG